MKMTGLMTEAQYAEQRKQIENQAEMLKIKQEIAKKKKQIGSIQLKRDNL